MTAAGGALTELRGGGVHDVPADEDLVAQAESDPAGLEEAVALEIELGARTALLGAGRELAFVASR